MTTSLPEQPVSSDSSAAAAARVDTGADGSHEGATWPTLSTAQAAAFSSATVSLATSAAAGTAGTAAAGHESGTSRSSHGDADATLDSFSESVPATSSGESPVEQPQLPAEQVSGIEDGAVEGTRSSLLGTRESRPPSSTSTVPAEPASVPSLEELQATHCSYMVKLLVGLTKQQVAQGAVDDVEGDAEGITNHDAGLDGADRGQDLDDVSDVDDAELAAVLREEDYGGSESDE